MTDPTKTPQNIEYLREHGVAALEELPGNKVTISDRRRGAAKFDIGDSQASGVTDSIGGMKTPVYYLWDDHDKVEVIEKWLDENPRVVEAQTRHGLRQRLRMQGKDWHDAIDEAYPKSEE